MTEQLMTTTEVADLLKIPIATLYHWRHRGVGPTSIRVGKHVRYRGRDVEAWLDAQTTVGDRASA